MALLFSGLVAALTLQLICGTPLTLNQQEYDDASRIMNGNAASPAQISYSISIQAVAQLSQATRGHSCGGVLVTLQHVLTSAACCYTGSGTPKQPQAYRAFGGAALLNNDTSPNHWRNISSFIVHPNYTRTSPPSHLYDIGIIVLGWAFPSTAGLAPLTVSSNAPAVAAQCTTAGWGATLAGGQASTTLQQVGRSVLNQTVCSVLLQATSGAPALQPTMLCGGVSTAFGVSCTNDTGNALVCAGTLSGVLSWFQPCSISSSVELYTRTASFAPWIQGVISPGGGEGGGGAGGGDGGGGGGGGGGGAPGAAPPTTPALAALLLVSTALVHFVAPALRH